VSGSATSTTLPRAQDDWTEKKAHSAQKGIRPRAGKQGRKGSRPRITSAGGGRAPEEAPSGALLRTDSGLSGVAAPAVSAGQAKGGGGGGAADRGGLVLAGRRPTE